MLEAVHRRLVATAGRREPWEIALAALEARVVELEARAAQDKQ